MNFRSLLVLLDAHARCDARVHLAARFAATHDSHLIGIAPTGLVDMPGALGPAARQLEEADAARTEALRLAEQRVGQFRARCKVEGVASVEGHVHEGDPATVLLHQAHCTDITVIGQAGADGPSPRADSRFVEQVLLHNARPTLLVPRVGRFDAFGDNVLVAWDDSHGCARAVSDALPLLRHAKQVHLRVWRRRGEAGDEPVRQRMDDVQRWLTRQGVSAEMRVMTTSGAIGDAILDHATQLGADLIVMGTYGHSRWTERIIGGATRTALARSPLPLLMSH